MTHFAKSARRGALLDHAVEITDAAVVAGLQLVILAFVFEFAIIAGSGRASDREPAQARLKVGIAVDPVRERDQAVNDGEVPVQRGVERAATGDQLRAVARRHRRERRLVEM